MDKRGKIVVLGGCGAVGSVAVRTLAACEDFSHVVIGDIDPQRSAGLAAEVAADSATNGEVSWVTLDGTDAASVGAAVAGNDVVLNCVGPFYKTVKTILGAVLDAGINYVDICDDVDVTLEILDWHQRAQNAGLTALIGMGASPGATNLLARYLYENELDETESIDIFHCHGGEPIEGPGVIGHRFHCMSIDIPMFLDGELTHVKYFEDDGIALRQTFDFPVLGKDIPLFPYPHPEQVTLPRYLDVRQVTNKGSVIPMEYYTLTGEMCRLGLTSKQPVEVAGNSVAPYDFAVAYLIRERERILRETNFGEQRGAMSVVLKGKRNGEPREVRAHMSSSSQALGEGTGIPAALGAILMQRGQIADKGVLPPEACVSPTDFLELAQRYMGLGAGDTDSESGGLTLETIDAAGNSTVVKL